MNTRNLDLAKVSALENGSIIIFTLRENFNYLDLFLRQKCSEIWVYLSQREGEKELRDYGKVRFSYNDQVSDVCRKIKEEVKK